VVEYLPSKCEALSSNPVPPKKNYFGKEVLNNGCFGHLVLLFFGGGHWDLNSSVCCLD
jgi:hypothetical protein